VPERFDPASARLLRRIHGDVRPPDEILSAIAVPGVDRDAHAPAERELVAGHLEGP
jgi:hypothetical protein